MGYAGRFPGHVRPAWLEPGAMNASGKPDFRSREAGLRAELAALPDPQQRLSWVVDRARHRPPFPPDSRTGDRLVSGCAARLWLVADVDPASGRCHFAADSDSAILKAMAGLVCELYDGLVLSEVIAGEPAFLADAGLLGQLTENRRRTVARVREAIREFARVEASRSTVATTAEASADGAARVLLVDAHNHLHDERFGGRQAELIAACRAAGIGRMVVNGSCEEDWSAVAALAAREPDLVVPAFGLHPWYVHQRSAGWRTTLERFLDATPGASVGEIGIDRWILDCPPAARAGVSPELAGLVAASLDEQVEVFREQLGIAATRGLAASIHCLQAWGRLSDVLRAGPRPERGFLLHSYGGPSELVEPLARLGARFGFPGYFLHERKARQREAFRAVPADRLLIETDAPDQRLPAAAELAAVTGTEAREHGAVAALAGEDGRPLNHPANLVLVYRGLAAWLGEPERTLARRVRENFASLFERTGVPESPRR